MKASTSSRVNKILIKALAIAFWILVWEALARYVSNEIIICSPARALARLFELLGTSGFYKTVAFSALRILCGFLSALIAGCILAALSSRFGAVRALLEPITSVIKATPVASFIILAIIWFGSRNLSLFISFLMVLPVVYLNVLKGIDSTDPELLEMSRVLGFSAPKKLIYVYFLQVWPYLTSGCSIALGLCWKSGVAAEVIGIPSGSLGEMLYKAKLYFETGDLLAWTAVIIVISAVFERIFMLLLRLIKRGIEVSRN